MTRMLDFEDFKREYQKAPVEEYPNNVLEAVPEPMVSVHVSTYQHADFIRDCLDGVLMQETDFPVEIIIGEDESDDGTREICKEYADRHPDKIRLFLHRRENNIKIHGRPTGRFQSTYTRFKCRGKYIAMCEGDDYWRDPEKLQKQVGFLEDNEGYVLSYHGVDFVYLSSQNTVESKKPSYNSKSFSKENMIKSPIILPVSMCHKKVMKRYPKEYFEVLNGDRFLLSLLGSYGKGKYQSRVKKSIYRKHKGGMWSSLNSISKERASRHTFDKLKKYHEKLGNSNIKNYFENKSLSSSKKCFYKSVGEGLYRVGLYEYLITTKKMILYDKYEELGTFTKRSIRYLLGNIKN